MGIFTLKTHQIVKTSLDEAWDFFSSPANLKVITPPTMGFDIITKEVANKMYEGQIIAYKVKPLLGIPMTWVTEITHVKDHQFFVDEQRKGPYSMWHHEHHFKAVPEGVEMIDIISYIPPMGFLGTIANQILIKNQLKTIFDFRFQKVETLFNK
jgi:ligand-binding SRPBCC domain-containing protein